MKPWLYYTPPAKVLSIIIKLDASKAPVKAKPKKWSNAEENFLQWYVTQMREMKIIFQSAKVS